MIEQTITWYDPKQSDTVNLDMDSALNYLENECKTSNIYAWANRDITVDTNPVLMYLAITNACNHKCKVCAWKDEMRWGRDENGEKQMGLMSLDLFKRIVDMMPEGVSRVYLQKTGESTLNKDLPAMMKYIKEQRPEIEVAMHSNATQLHKPEITNAILEYLDFFTISFFGVSRDTYNTAHGKKDFDLVFENSLRFQEAYQKSPRKPRVFFDYVSQQCNQNESDEEVFEFFNKRFPDWSAGIHYTFNFQGFGEEGHLNIFDTLPYEQFPQCVLPWMAFTVLWDGKVDYCFVDPKESHFLGDVYENTISEIWNSEPYREFRRMMVEKRFDEMKEKEINCGNCSWLFGQKTQSASTLALGKSKFAPQLKPRTNSHTIVDVKCTGQEYLLSGYLNFLKGEIGNALKDFYLSKEVSSDVSVQNRAQAWIESCKKIFQQKKDVEAWEAHLQADGETLHNVHVSRYQYSKADMVLTKSRKAAV